MKKLVRKPIKDIYCICSLDCVQCIPDGEHPSKDFRVVGMGNGRLYSLGGHEWRFPTDRLLVDNNLKKINSSVITMRYGNKDETTN
jgi:hypothetical protein